MTITTEEAERLATMLVPLSDVATALRSLAAERDALREALDTAKTMLQTGMPEYDASDVLEVVRAILAGRKTQTRRVIKPVPTFNGGGACHDADALQQDYVEPYWVFPETCKYGAPGDTLWVREAHALSANPDLKPWYRLDHPEARSSGPRADVKWRPSSHMPRWASRLTLEVKSVRVERLQDISEDDARAEGVSRTDWEYDDGECCDNDREAFSHLWNRINGPGAWDANPWVWVISFERVKP